MEDLGSRIKQVTHELKDYFETRLELTFLNFSDKFTYWIGQSIQQLFGYAILGIGLVFAMTALAIYLGEILDERWAGYLIVASPFLIIGLLFIFVKPQSIARKIQNQILTEIIDSISEKKEVVKTLPTKGTQNKQADKNG